MPSSNAVSALVSRPAANGGGASHLNATADMPALDLHLGVDGDDLQASLTDGSALLLVGETPQWAGRLDALAADWKAAGGPGQLHRWGARLAELLPARIRRHLDTASGCALRLHLHPELALLPWDLTHDGQGWWHERFAVSRVLATALRTARPARPEPVKPRPLAVLLMAHPDFQHHWPPALFEQLTAQWLARGSVKAQLATAASLHEEPPTPPDPGLDVLHLAGPLEQLLDWLESDSFLAAAAQSSRLLLLQCSPRQHPEHASQEAVWRDSGRRLATIGTGSRGVCIIQHADASVPAAHATASRLYELLAEGESLGRSGNLPRTGATSIAVLGDLDATLVPRMHAMAERSFRQVTVLSYDLVGSTEMMHRIGLEAYSIALQNCHERFAGIIRQWGGVSDAPQGDDGIMCYFGVHQADETTARSALFAALDLIEEAQQLDARIRIGMATGMVAISGAHYVGLTVHLAARIQALASPGQVLVSDSTAELVATSFELTPFLRDGRLKGFQDSTQVFQVEKPKDVQQWARWSADQRKPLLGREREMGLLRALWAAACAGTSHGLHLYGEAGIGKSHMVSTLVHEIEGNPQHKSIMCRCFPETSTRAFAPVAQLIERWLGITAGDALEARAEKVLHGLQAGLMDADEAQSLVQVLGLPTAIPGASTLNRRQMLKVMVGWTAGSLRQRPLCLVVEDIQWADPSSMEFFSQLRQHTQHAPLLLVLTERLDRVPAAPHALASDALHVQRLAADAVRALIQSLAGSQQLPRRTMEVIEQRSDGVPLFIELSTRMALEAVRSREAGGYATAADFQVPATVRDLLMQRLDGLGAARQLIQVCAAIGREFPLELVTAVAQDFIQPLDPAKIQRLLAALVQGGLLMASQRNTSRLFWFRHALIQEVAYLSMWESDRRSLHRSIAQTLQADFAELCTTQPGVMARHFAASGALPEAVHWHLLAARQYKKNEAHIEALAHLDEAQRHLQMLPDEPGRRKTELDIELTRAGPLVVTRGYGAASVGECFERAMALSQVLDDRKSLLRAQLGVEVYHFARGDFGQAHACLAQAQATASHFRDPLTTAMCQWAYANLLFHQGEVTTALERMQECIAGCRAHTLQVQLAQSPEVMSLMYSAFCFWETGLADQSIVRVDEAVTLAQATHQRLGTGQALGMKAMILVLRGDLEEAVSVSERAVALCESGDHEMWTAHARFILGCARAELGHLQAGVETMDAADALWAATGSILTRSFYLSMRARAHARLQKHDQARRLIGEALGIVCRHGERYFEPEVLRIQGELLLASGAPSSETLAAARQHFERAVSAARMRKLVALELRALTSLVQLMRQQDDPDRLRQREQELDRLLLQLTEGRQTRDWVQARKCISRPGEPLDLL